MTIINSSSIRALTLLSCVSIVSLLAACGSPDGGYYDAGGNWVGTDTSYGKSYPDSKVTHGYRRDRDNYGDNRYSRRGYYDREGYYVERDGSMNVPDDMFPPRGMCRVWFTNRSVSDQPGVESCDDIMSRVPAGAYVIYGG